MSAVIRVKRRIDEEPLNAFILNCKRPKLDNQLNDSLLSTKDEVSTIVKFAATVESQDETAALQIAKLTKDEAKQLAQKSRSLKPNISERGRQEMRENSHENRFKVVNYYRAIKTDDSTTNNEITIVDVEKQTVNGTTQLPEVAQSSTSSLARSSTAAAAAATSNEDNFVYDLYLAETNQPTDSDFVENYFSVRPFDDLVYEDQNNDALIDDSDSEDSNQENYFCNDYPDTEDGSSVGERDMRRAMQDVDIDSNYDLSSDEEENCRNGFVYSVDSEAIGFEDDIDYCDVNRYGEAFARYKGKSTSRPEAIYNDNESDCSDQYGSDDK